MSLQNLTTNNKKEIVKTNRDGLIDLLHATLGPVEALYELLEDAYSDGPVSYVLSVLRPLIDRQKADLERIEKVIFETLGYITVESPFYGQTVEVDGRKFYYGEYIRARLEPKGTGA